MDLQELVEIWRKLYAGELEPRIGDFIGYMGDGREGVIPKDEVVFLAPEEW